MVVVNSNADDWMHDEDVDTVVYEVSIFDTWSKRDQLEPWVPTY